MVYTMSVNKITWCLGITLFFSSGSVMAQKIPVKWLTLQQLATVQVSQPRKVIVEIYSEECNWCKKFETEVLTNKVIASYINQHYYLVKVEVSDKSTIQFNDKELKSTNGFHPLTSEYLTLPLSFPTQLFFDEHLHYLNFLKGYNTPQNFEIALAYYGDNYYKTANWADFLKSFKGKVKLP